MTPTEEKLLDALQDAEAAFGLLEATLMQAKLEPVAEIVRGFRNKAAAAIAVVSRETFTEISGTGYAGGWRPPPPIIGWVIATDEESPSSAAPSGL